MPIQQLQFKTGVGAGTKRKAGVGESLANLVIGTIDAGTKILEQKEGFEEEERIKQERADVKTRRAEAETRRQKAETRSKVTQERADIKWENYLSSQERASDNRDDKSKKDSDSVAYANLNMEYLRQKREQDVVGMRSVDEEAFNTKFLMENTDENTFVTPYGKLKLEQLKYKMFEDEDRKRIVENKDTAIDMATGFLESANSTTTYEDAKNLGSQLKELYPKFKMERDLIKPYISNLIVEYDSNVAQYSKMSKAEYLEENPLVAGVHNKKLTEKLYDRLEAVDNALGLNPDNVEAMVETKGKSTTSKSIQVLLHNAQTPEEVKNVINTANKAKVGIPQWDALPKQLSAQLSSQNYEEAGNAYSQIRSLRSQGYGIKDNSVDKIFQIQTLRNVGSEDAVRLYNESKAVKLDKTQINEIDKAVAGDFSWNIGLTYSKRESTILDGVGIGNYKELIKLEYKLNGGDTKAAVEAVDKEVMSYVPDYSMQPINTLGNNISEDEFDMFKADFANAVGKVIGERGVGADRATKKYPVTFVSTDYTNQDADWKVIVSDSSGNKVSEKTYSAFKMREYMTNSRRK